MVEFTAVRWSLLARLAPVSVLEAGGKPSTWFPPGGLVEPTSQRELPEIFFNRIAKNDFSEKNLGNRENHKI